MQTSIAGGLLWKNLRSQKLRKKRYGKAERRGTIPNRVSIDDRAAIVETRSRIGDWEADTVIGKNIVRPDIRLQPIYVLPNHETSLAKPGGVHIRYSSSQALRFIFGPANRYKNKRISYPLKHEL